MAAGDLGLAGARDVPLAAAVTIVTSLSAASKPMSGVGDVVDDDGVEALALELLAPVRDGAVAVLGGEADQHLAGAPAGGEPGQHVLGALERELHAAPGSSFLILPAAAPAGR